MGKSSLSKTKPPTLQQLVDLFNDKKISVEELTEKAIPLLERQRLSWIYHFMGQLASDSPDRYHISSPHHKELWNDAVAAYDAKITAQLAASPSVRIKLEETVQRAEAALHEQADQSASI